MNRLPSLLWLALLVLPLVEVGSHFAARAVVPEPGDYQRAADFVREQLAPKDLIVAAPSWTDPRVREVLGDRIDLAMAGRSDAAAYERVWSLSIRGARPDEAPPGRAPDLSRDFGRVTVQRWALGPSRVLADLTRELPRAEVRQGGKACAWKRFELPRGGGLGTGVLAPRERFACGGARAPWVAPVVMEDLSLTPRHCVLQPPTRTPTRVTLRDLPLGEEIVLYAGLYYEHERMRQGAPVTLRVLSGERELGRMLHRDGEGWKRMTVRSPAPRGDVSIEVSGSDSKPRHFCWSATTRSGEAR